MLSVNFNFTNLSLGTWLHLGFFTLRFLRSLVTREYDHQRTTSIDTYLVPYDGDSVVV